MKARLAEPRNVEELHAAFAQLINDGDLDYLGPREDLTHWLQEIIIEIKTSTPNSTPNPWTNQAAVEFIVALEKRF